ncbi:MAG: Tn3 family transposase, partial [Chloroflexi bacterium]|nr:Tn3 family transposase [Chloroflexota bacterium]
MDEGPRSILSRSERAPPWRPLATVFWYGTKMGPSQAARSLIGLDRRQIEWINQHHVVEDGLDEAGTIIVNGYHRFLLTRVW